MSAITCLVKRKCKKSNLMLKILNETVNLTVLSISVHSGGIYDFESDPEPCFSSRQQAEQNTAALLKENLLS